MSIQDRSPFFKVFTESGEITENISDFKFKHTEKNDDELDITFETSDVNLPDRDDLQEGKRLKTYWGYIGGKFSRVRIVYIEDIKCVYNTTSIKMTIKAYDKAFTLKHVKSQTIHEENNADEVAKKIAEKHGLKYDGWKLKEDDTVEFVTQTQETSGGQIPSIIEENLLFKEARSSTAAPVKVAFKIYKAIPQANKTDFQMLKQLTQLEPGGPYVVTGHDDELIIKKRDLDQQPIKEYIYTGSKGDLISFEPETINRREISSTTNVETSGVEAENKVTTKSNSNVVTNIEQIKLCSEIIGSVRSNKLEGVDPDEEEDNIYTPLQSDSLSFNKNLETQEIQKLKHADFVQVHGFTVRNKTPEDKLDIAAVDKTDAMHTKGLLDFTEKIHTVEEKPEDIKAVGDNYQADKELERNPAKAVVVGDPHLESGKIVRMLNVSKKYSCSYYIQEVMHNFSRSGGYLTTLTLATNATGMNEAKNTFTAAELGIKENKKSGPEDSENEIFLKVVPPE